MADDALLTTETPETPAAAPVDTWASDSETSAAALAEPTADAVPVADESAESDAAPLAEAAPLERGDDGKFKPRSGKPRNDPQARVQQATSQAALAKEEARQAREEAAQLKTRLEAFERAHVTPPAPVVPDPADLDRFYQDPLAATRTLAEEVARNAVAQYQQQQAAQATQQAFLDRLATFTTDHPDYDAVVQRAPNVPGVMLEAIRLSPLGPQIAYDLGSHPEDTAQLARELQSLTPDAVPLVRRLLEARVTGPAVLRPDSAAPVVRSSAATPPINRVGGTAAAAPVDPEDLEFGPEFIRLENARDKQRAAGGRW